MSTFGIRPYQLEDVDELYAAADESREHVARWMGWMKPDYSREHVRTWLEFAVKSWERGESYEHAIIDTADGSIVGACGLNSLKREDGYCNLGYWVRSSRIGDGAARQATLLLRDFGFATLELNRIEIVVADGNDYSRAVAKSVGAIYEGLHAMRLKIGETTHDAHIYALLNLAAKRAKSCGTFPERNHANGKVTKVRTLNWMDMIVSEPERVSRFYIEVVGLGREAVEEDATHTSYALHNEAGDEVLGICDEGVFPDWVEGWLPYIDIDDFDARVAKVLDAGGAILKQMTMNYRWKGQRFCLVSDPSGAPLMLCESQG